MVDLKLQSSIHSVWLLRTAGSGDRSSRRPYSVDEIRFKGD